jgi:hypothetical protein
VITPDIGISKDVAKRVSSGVFIETIDFSPMRLITATKKIRSKLTADPNGYSNYLLTKIMPALASPLSIMYSSFLSIS